MFIKRKVMIALVLTLAMGTGIGVFASQHFTVKYTNRTNESDKKTQILLNDAYADILNSLKDDFDINQYTQVAFDELDDLNLLDKYLDLYQDPPVGSTYPMIFVSNKKNEILVLYKEVDGSNIVKSSKLNSNNNKWEENDKKNKSKKYLDFKSIEPN